MPARIAATLASVHGGPRFLRDFDMLSLADAVRGRLGGAGLSLALRVPGAAAHIQAIGRVLAARPLPAVPCHNDLLADNSSSRRRLRLLDWEYSGNGDPAFELGNNCRELDYGEGQVEELCGAYSAGRAAPLVARVLLHMIVSDVGWSLWAAIQTAISRIAFDFEAYGAARWTRAEAAMDAADFARWMDAVARPGDGTVA